MFDGHPSDFAHDMSTYNYAPRLVSTPKFIQEILTCPNIYKVLNNAGNFLFACEMILNPNSKILLVEGNFYEGLVLNGLIPFLVGNRE